MNKMAAKPAPASSTLPAIGDLGTARNASSTEKDNVLPTVTAGVSIFVIIFITGLCIWIQRRKHFRERKTSRTDSDYTAGYSVTTVNEGSDVRKKSCHNSSATRSDEIVDISDGDCERESSSKRDNHLSRNSDNGDELKCDPVNVGVSDSNSSDDHRVKD